MRRKDDTPEAIATRLGVYERDTEPLLAFYESRGLLVVVNGDQEMDEVTAALEAAVHERGLA